MPGDRILSVAGQSTRRRFDDIASVVAVRPNETVAVELERGRAGAAAAQSRCNPTSSIDGTGRKMQARPARAFIRRTTIGAPVSIFRAVPMAVDHTARLTRAIVDGLGQLDRRARFRRSSSADRSRSPSLPEPAAQHWALCRSSACSRCSQLISDSSTSCQSRCWMEAICSSMPIEAVRRRPLSARALEWAFRGGLAAHPRVAGFHDVQRSRLARPVGPASTLDWLGGLGQGCNTGLGGGARRRTISQKAGTSDFKVE